MKWWAKATSSLNPAKWHPLIPFLIPHILQSSYILGQTHQPVVWWITAGCLFVKGICSQLKVTQALTDIWLTSETSHSQSSPSNVQHQYLRELLVNVYNYRLLIKKCFLMFCESKVAFLIWSQCHLLCSILCYWVRITVGVKKKFT